MPLILDLKPGDKVIVNGAVLENVGGNGRIALHNEAALLRQKEVLAEEDAQTPASRVYFALQCAYVFIKHRDDYLTLFTNLLSEFVGAVPSVKPVADKVMAAVEEGKFYPALKEAQKLIQAEIDVVAQLRHDLEESADASGDA